MHVLCWQEVCEEDALYALPNATLPGIEHLQDALVGESHGAGQRFMQNVGLVDDCAFIDVDAVWSTRISRLELQCGRTDVVTITSAKLASFAYCHCSLPN